MKKTDIWLKEVPIGNGITPKDIGNAMVMLAESTPIDTDNPEIVPVEVDNPNGSSSAMGFVAVRILDETDADYILKLAGEILGDMNLESKDGFYYYDPDKLCLMQTRDVIEEDNPVRVFICR